MEDIIDIIVTETTNTIEITAQPNDEIIDVNIIDNREDIVLNVTPTVVEININSLTSNFGVEWGDITGTLADQEDLQDALDLKANLVDGKVPSSELPSYVDDVVEVATFSALPATGEIGKIYVILDTNKIYRWSGSTYIEIADSTAVWGAITGTLSSQIDLQSALDAKQDDLNGTGFVKASGTTITYDNSTYLTTSSAASTYVPYTGATGNVDLGTHKLTSYDLVVNHGSGSGVAVSITKGGSGEALTVVKSSGSGNAASITGGVTLISELHLTTDLADAYIASATNWNGAYNDKINSAEVTGTTTKTLTLTQQDGGTVTASWTDINTDAVTSVFGRTGAVIAANGDYTTTQVTEGDNLYFTNARARGAISLTVSGSSGASTYDSATGVLNVPTYTLSGLGGQPALSGTGFVKISGTTISYDNSTYLTTSSAASTYLALAGGTLTGAVTGTRLTLSQNSADITLSIGNAGTGRAFSVLGTSYFSTDIQLGYATNAILKTTALGVITSAIAGTDYQAPLSGTGFVKISGSTISYDNSTYLTTASASSTYLTIATASSTYLPLAGGTLTGALSGTSALFSSAVRANNPSEGATGEGLIAGQSFKIDGTGTSQKAVMYMVSNVLSDTYASGLTAQFGNFAGDKGFGFNLNTSGGYELYVKNTTWNKALTISNTNAVTLTGALSGTSATFSSNVTTTQLITKSASGTAALFLKDGSSVDKWEIGHITNNLYFYNYTRGGNDLILNGSTGAATFSSSVTATSIGVNGAPVYSGLESSTGTFGSTVALLSLAVKDGTYNPRTTVSYRTQTGSAYAVIFDSSYSSGWASTNYCFASGNVGIGTTSIINAISGTETVLKISNSNAASLYLEVTGVRAYANYVGANGSLVWYDITAATPRMAITSGGNVLIGQTTASGSTNGIYFRPGIESGFIVTNDIALQLGRLGSTGDIQSFYTGTTRVGTISVSGSATSYNTTSDYRLKQDLKSFNGLEVVNKINTYDYEWKSDNTRSFGVLAHELAEVLPYAVMGVKDGETMQGVDYSKIVPVMVQAIKELKAELDTLKNK